MGILDRYVALHIETTGIDAHEDEIIEIAGAIVRDGEVDGEYHAYVRPWRRKVTPVIEQITGITAARLGSARRIDDVLPEFYEFAAGLPAFAHNAPFVAEFIAAADPIASITAVYDSLELARIALPNLSNFRLETLLAAYGIAIEPDRRAQSDLRAFATLVEALVDTLSAHPVGRLEALNALAAEARPADPPVGNIANLLQEIAERAVRRGLADAEAPAIAEHLLVRLPNTLGAGAKEKLEPSGSDVSVDPAVVRRYLGSDGALANALDHYEERESQVRMAEAVTGAFNEGHFLVCEAGTGTGKSLAYLAPAILWAVANGRRVIVSTNTKTLQEQLFYKDLPLIAKTLGVQFRAALLKGRGNYLCLNRWRSGKVPGYGVTTDRERGVALPIATWAAATTSGDISEVTAFSPSGPGRTLWAKLSTEGQPCSPTACPSYGECWLMRIRRSAQQAHVVVVNHSLLFSDLAAEHSILGEYADVVIDEAHNLERVASQYLGAELTWWALRDLSHRIHYREAHESGLLRRINDGLPQGTLPRNDVKSYGMQIARAIDANAAFLKSGQEFFEKLVSVVPASTSTSGFAEKRRYLPDEGVFDAAMGAREALHDALKKLTAELSTLAEWFRELQPGKVHARDEYVVDLENRISDLDALDGTIVNLTEAADESLVYWYEMPVDSGKYDIRLYAAPLRVGERLAQHFFPALRTVVMTSATLAVAGKFAYFVDRVGLADGDLSSRVRTLEVGSPFDYDAQVLVGVPGWFPSPKRPREFQDAVTEFVRDAVLRTRRGTLVLFTSYRMLNDTYKAVRGDFSGHGILLLGQGLDGSRTNLADIFRRERESVLFGTESFWQGVDVPGEALEMLIIVKLPFTVPTEPLAIAQGEELRKNGRDPFLYLAVPEAAIRFRQGFGRLIRSKQDRGAVVILDTRVSTERFGRAFLRSLPTGHHVYKTSESMLDALDDFFHPKVVRAS